MGSAPQSTAKPARLNVKLAARTQPLHSAKILSETPGVLAVTQTFPDEQDEELSRLFVVEVDPAKSAEALKTLQDNPAIEYAEPTARRKLIR
jgi:hypothetical protein